MESLLLDEHATMVYSRLNGVVDFAAIPEQKKHVEISALTGRTLQQNQNQAQREWPSATIDCGFEKRADTENVLSYYIKP